MVTIANLEKKRIDKIRSLEPSEIDSYIDSLVKKFTDSSLKFDIEGMQYSNEKIDELYELLTPKFNNLGNCINYAKLKYSSDLVMFYRIREMIHTFKTIKKTLMEYEFNVNHDSLVLVYLLRNVLELYHETKSESIKKFDFIIGIVYRNYIFHLNLFQSFLNELEGYDEYLILFLEGFREAISENQIIKENNVLEAYDDMLDDVKEIIENMEKYNDDLKHNFKWLEEENPFDDYSFEFFYDFLFEKYPFMLELDEDSDEYKEKAKEIPSGLLEPFMMEEPQYILSEDECRFVLPSEVEGLTDSMKDLIKEVEAVGYTEY